MCRQLAVLGKLRHWEKWDGVGLSSKACWSEGWGSTGHLSVASYSPLAPKNRSLGCATHSSRKAQPGVLDALGYVFRTQVA
uniref:Macaca fascicularis brain cDNA, clone: QtrA-15881 n=1 Tax=Macaca fascicularis TaxID=9541 RepID=I7G995_MACFA|nr:unnamed protein product [Macaca fascicularis]